MPDEAPLVEAHEKKDAPRGLEVDHYRLEANSFDFKPDQGELLDFMLDLMNCRNLVVLSGLGTSGNLDGFVSMPDLMRAARGITDPSYESVTKKVYRILTIGKDEEDPPNPGHQTYKSAPKEPTDVEQFLSDCMAFASVTDDDKVKDYCDKLSNIAYQMCRFPNRDDPKLEHHITFLRKIAKRSAAHARAQLFTTNYDMAFDHAASRAGVIGLDGFSFASTPEFSALNYNLDVIRRDSRQSQLEPLSGVYYYHKMHGSVDWDRKDIGDHHIVVKNPNPTNPVMVYPNQGKFEQSFEDPFIDMMARFQSALRESNVGLIVAGYGFRDKHINSPIRMALRQNESLKMVVVDRGYFPEETKGTRGEYHKHLMSLVRDEKDRRIQLVKCDFHTFAQQLPAYMNETERERMEQRMKKRGW